MGFKIALSICLTGILIAGEINTPTQYLNVGVGNDRTLIGWEEIHSYFKYIGENSSRVSIEHLGQTTLGRDFIMAVIADEQNITRVNQIRENQQKLALGQPLSDAESVALISDTPLILLVTFNIHSTEIGSSQVAVELLYELASRDQDMPHNILVLMVPSVNPDGQQMVTDWYRNYVHTSYEGAPLPQLYHHYAGHDNNRDWHYFNLQESKLLAHVLYQKWLPEIVYDQHQMGSRGPRIFLPPYADPVNPVIPPALTAQVNYIGEKVVSDLHHAGFQGIATGTIFNAYFQGTLSKTPLWHNRIGILCEIASTRVASPLFFPYGSLESFGPDLPEYKMQSNFLDPWPGGWWRLRNIMDLEKAVFYSILNIASLEHFHIKQQFTRLNMENIKRGASEAPFGYFIPVDQRDRSALKEMLIKLQRAGVHIESLTRSANLGLRQFEPGTFYITCAQPARNYIIDLFQVHHYPERRQYSGGPPLEPYDITTWNMPLQMGVEVFEDMAGVYPETRPVEQIDDRSFYGSTAGSGNYVLFGPESNWSVSMALRLIGQNIPVRQALESFRSDDMTFPAGTFVVDSEGEHAWICKMLNTHGINAHQFHDVPDIQIKTIGRADIALYQPVFPSMDEGWTRWLLDSYEIKYKIIDTRQLEEDKIDRNIKTLIIPSLRPEVLTKGMGAYYKQDKKIADIQILPEYMVGLSKTGVGQIRQFVNGGGRLILLHQSIRFFSDSLGLPVSDLNQNLPRNEFYIPGALLHMDLDPANYICYGLPRRINVFYDSRGVIMKLLPYVQEVATPGIFPEHNLLSSGWMLGDKWLHNRIGLADIPVGEGNVILIGFRPQHRGQTYGTFGLLFNSLIH